MIRSIFMFSVLALLMSCATSSNSNSDNGYIAKQNSTTLVDHIHSLAGVVVNGDGASARIRVRGTNSTGFQNAPLFIVNGVDMGNEFSNVYAAVSPTELQSVKLLKDPSETGIYGVRGANGVIIIRTKGVDARYVN